MSMKTVRILMYTSLFVSVLSILLSIYNIFILN